jgi:DNA-binding beta-propeller fold protein YncE
VSVGNFIRRSAYILLLCCIAPGDTTFATSSQRAPAGIPAPAGLSFVRAFSSAEDVRRSHPVLGRTLDIIAGPKAPEPHVDALQSPSAVVTDSNHRVFVADPGANVVHIFDFVHSKYALMDKGGDRPGSPVSLAVDGHDNLYVVDRSRRTVIIYDSAGKFLGHFWKQRGESYFESPAGIAIDKTTGLAFVCDRQRHMVIIMDNRGRVISKIGKRGGGDQPGEFRLPTQVVISGGEVFVLDAGNTRIQVLDIAGHFLRAIRVPYADAHTGLAVDERGTIYVSNPDLNQIQLFCHDGRRLSTFDPTTTKGENFGHPSAMWVDAGDCLYVVDSQSKRVGLFQITGQNARQCQ